MNDQINAAFDLLKFKIKESRSNNVKTDYSNEQFHYIEGTVVDERTSSKTKIFGSVSGGGGSISTGPFGVDVRGHIDPVRGNIGSTTTETQEFWLRQNDGNEIHINLGGNTVPLRTGHEIAMVYLGDFMCFLYIKNTDQVYQMSTGPYKDIWSAEYVRSGLTGCGVSALMIILSIGAFIYALAKDSNASGFVALLLLVGAVGNYIALVVRERKQGKESIEKCRKNNEDIMTKARNFLQEHITASR